MKDKILKYRVLFQNNIRIVENYFFMTVLQILNSLFYLLIYPFLIRTLGSESYGLYVFSMAVSVYFVSFVQFGFDTPALREVSLNPKDISLHSKVLSTVFFLKLLLFVITLFVFVPLLIFIDVFRMHYLLFLICYLQVFSNILLPTWYFQAIQKMKVITYIQLSLKILSLPLIFFIIKQPSDIEKFAAITIFTSIIGGVVALLLLVYKIHVKLYWVSIAIQKRSFKDAIPFFLSSSMNTVKQQTASILIGSYFTMSDVALYDLAMKIFMVPTTLISSVNGALFPKIIVNANTALIKKVIRVENLIGIFIIFGLAIFGKWIILIMGGKAMLGAFPLLIIISLSIFVSLTVGAICNFIFVPLKYYRAIARDQLLALLVFLFVAFGGVFFGVGIYTLPLALTISGFSEIIYCYSVVRKNRMYEQITK